jgi:hypothetical protein
MMDMRAGTGYAASWTTEGTSGKMARTEIRRSSGLSDEEIAREAKWVRSLCIP